eukprot:GHVN01064542.1.p1 GENE.GHVN01064542.1~~GHVN01064542.1.p1  ORF type:complete len:317 (+),score=21.80 GHVN01064542.1:172-1122(+)
MDATLSCSDLKGIVMAVEEGGVGYTANLLFPMFLKAVETGRLFFVDWPHPWEPVFRSPGFDWDYKTNVEKGRICLHGDMVRVRGDYCRISHPIAQLPVLNPYQSAILNRVRTIANFIRPSAEVEALMQPVRDAARGKTMVTVSIRTGVHDYIRFLKSGDEILFLQCVTNWLRKFPSDVLPKVFLTSDDETVKAKAERLLKSHGADVLRIKDSYIHVAHDVKNADSNVLERVQKTIAEFLLISESDYAFLTQDSLFGFIAAEVGKIPRNQQFFVSSSDCETPGMESYVRCAKPKFPPICFDFKKQHEMLEDEVLDEL